MIYIKNTVNKMNKLKTTIITGLIWLGAYIWYKWFAKNNKDDKIITKSEISELFTKDQIIWKNELSVWYSKIIDWKWIFSNFEWSDSRDDQKDTVVLIGNYIYGVRWVIDTTNIDIKNYEKEDVINIYIPDTEIINNTIDYNKSYIKSHNPNKYMWDKDEISKQEFKTKTVESKEIWEKELSKEFQKNYTKHNELAVNHFENLVKILYSNIDYEKKLIVNIYINNNIAKEIEFVWKEKETLTKKLQKYIQNISQ